MERQLLDRQNAETHLFKLLLPQFLEEQIGGMIIDPAAA